MVMTDLSRNRKVLAVVALVVVALATYGVWRWINPSGPVIVTRGYFTDDDGETLFVDAIMRKAPFDHGGKIAVRAHAFSADGGKTRFVGYLEKDSPDVATRRAEALARGESENLDTNEPVVKKPGDPNAPWLSRLDEPKFSAIIDVMTPDGRRAMEVHP